MKNINESMNQYNTTSNNGQLYGYYEEALKDEKFKRLVDALNIDPKILMKYTSSLEESAIEYDNCMHCHNILGCKNKINGYIYLPNIDGKRIRFDYVACKKTQKNNKENRYMKNVYVFDIPEEIKKAKISDIYIEYKERFNVITYLNDFIKNYGKKESLKGLYLHGNFGCGKTYLVAAAFNELAKKGYKSAIVFWPEFLGDLKTSFQTDFKEKFDKVKKVPLLLIDDIGAENTTNWGRDDILCPLLQYRMDEGLTTFFTSNMDIKSLEEHFAVTKESVQGLKAKRLIERVKQLTTDMEMMSNNLRK